MANVTFKTRAQAEAYATEMGGTVVKQAAKKFVVQINPVGNVEEQKPEAAIEVAVAKVAKVTKVQQVIDMLQSGGASVVQIAHLLEISKIAAQSLIGDVKRKGYNVVRYKEGELAGLYVIPGEVELFEAEELEVEGEEA